MPIAIGAMTNACTARSNLPMFRVRSLLASVVSFLCSSAFDWKDESDSERYTRICEDEARGLVIDRAVAIEPIVAGCSTRMSTSRDALRRWMIVSSADASRLLR